MIKEPRTLTDILKDNLAAGFIPIYGDKKVFGISNRIFGEKPKSRLDKIFKYSSIILGISSKYALYSMATICYFSR